MKLLRSLSLLAVALVVATSLALVGRAARVSAAAAAPLAVYQLVGTATTTGVSSTVLCNPDADVNLCPGYGTATAICSQCAPAAPTTGSLSFLLQHIGDPGGACSAQKASGTMTLTWPDTSTSSASVSGRFFDDKQNLTLEGTFNPQQPNFAGDTVSLVLDGFPPNPCLAATNAVTGTLSIFPPSPN